MDARASALRRAPPIETRTQGAARVSMGSGGERNATRGTRGTLGGERPARLVWTYGIWFALAFGLLDGVAVLVHRDVLGQLTRASEHVFWMAPVANLPPFLAVSGALVLVGRFVSRDRLPIVAIGVFVALGSFGLLRARPVLHEGASALLALGFAALAARLVATRREGFRVLVARSRWPLVAVVALVAIGTFGARALRERRAIARLPAPAPEAPDILFLLLDTVRAQSMSLYDYAVSTTPRLEEFARRGVTFDRAISTAPWTLPSIGSIFTGRYPHDLRVGFLEPLDDRYPTLAEVLGGAGYETAGFIGNLLYASREMGLARGFQRYEDYEVAPGQLFLSSSLTRSIVTSTWLRNALGWHELANRKAAEGLNRDFLRWLDGRSGERPYFAFINYFDAHEPYLPDPPYDVLFGPEPIERDLWHFGDLLRGNEGRRPDAWLEQPEDPWKDLRAYEGAVAQLDAAVGRLLDALTERGALENTIVVVVADHGEQLGEHGLFYHWNSLYMSLIHVPLILYYPDLLPGGRRVPGAVSLADLPTTLLEMAGSTPRGAIPGRSLLGPATGDESAAVGVEVTPPLSELERGPTFSMVDDGYHYIVVPSARTEELYDISADPGEFEDLTGRVELQDRLRTLRQLTIQELETPRDAVLAAPFCASGTPEAAPCTGSLPGGLDLAG